MNDRSGICVCEKRFILYIWNLDVNFNIGIIID